MNNGIFFPEARRKNPSPSVPLILRMPTLDSRLDGSAISAATVSPVSTGGPRLGVATRHGAGRLTRLCSDRVRLHAAIDSAHAEIDWGEGASANEVGTELATVIDASYSAIVAPGTRGTPGRSTNGVGRAHRTSSPVTGWSRMPKKTPDAAAPT